MAIACYDNVQLWMQTQDGEMIEFSGHVQSISLTETMRGVIEMDFSIWGSNALVSRILDKSKATVSELRQSSEWKCAFCDRPNPRDNTVCDGCGGVRPFIYD